MSDISETVIADRVSKLEEAVNALKSDIEYMQSQIHALNCEVGMLQDAPK